MEKNINTDISNSTVSNLCRWLIKDDSLYNDLSNTEKNSIDGFRLSVFLLLHLGCLGVFYVGFSWTALLLACFLYFSRMFFITAFYHRYFCHRTYTVSRPMQLMMAIAGSTAGQRGPLWWASHHRNHHSNSDTSIDPHSPSNGLLNSHLLWFLRKGNFPTQDKRINDLLRYPELRFNEKFDWLPFLLLFAACFTMGEFLASGYPELETNGMQLLVWGGFVSSVFLYHATYSINSLAHLFGKRRFNTPDDSRNNFWLALLTLGEGWHNNHHRYPTATRQGFYRGEIDISFMLLNILAALGLVKNFRVVPIHILKEGRKR